jgi:hypothetical protein
MPTTTVTVNINRSAATRDDWSPAAREAAARARKMHAKGAAAGTVKSSTGHTAAQHSALAKEHQAKADQHETQANKGGSSTESHSRMAAHHERIAQEHRTAAHHLLNGDKADADLSAETAKERTARNPLKRR